MIITKIQGGLGNQMFQYAMGRHLAKINNIKLKLDTSYYKSINKNDTSREYLLKHFNIKEEFATADDIKKMPITNLSDRSLVLKIKMKLLKYIEKTKPIYNRSYIKESDLNFSHGILKIKNKKNVYLFGCWQSEKYFKNIKDIIRKEFTLKNKLSEEGEKIKKTIKNINSTSIHVRRNDYLKHDNYYNICSMEYYRDAIKKIVELVENPHFFIFSDDMKWVKNNLKIKFPLTFIGGNSIKDYEELILMSKCKHNIIANSSFSWWGAWLNNNPDKIVIAPKKWFNISSNDTSNLCPESWIRL